MPGLNLDLATISHVCGNDLKIVLLQDAINKSLHSIRVSSNDTELEVGFPVCIDKLVDNVWYVLVRDTMEIKCGFHYFSSGGTDRTYDNAVNSRGFCH